MANALSTLWRNLIDRSLALTNNTFSRTPLVSTQAGFDNTVRKGSDLLFPLLAVIRGAYVTSQGTTLTVNIAGGLCRDASGNVVEMPPQSAVPVTPWTAPASGKQQYQLISFDPVAKSYSFTAGTAANTGTAVPPTVPQGQIPVATVLLSNAQTTPQQAAIDNTYQIIW